MTRPTYRRLVTAVGTDECKAKLYYDSEWDEYQVELWRNGAKDDGATYFTGDYGDAIATAYDMVGQKEGAVT